MQKRIDELVVENARLRETIFELKPDNLVDSAYYWKMVAKQQTRFSNAARTWARYWKRRALKAEAKHENP